MESQEPSASDAPISPETLLAIRRYNQEVASYTLRQWNVAKLESERKERDRRRRRADMLAQRQHQQSSAGAGTAYAHANAVGNALSHSVAGGARPGPSGPRPFDGYRPNAEGPLMMVSKRRSERERVGTSASTPSSGLTQAGYRPSHEPQRHDHPNRAHHSHAHNASSIQADSERLNQTTPSQPAHTVGTLQSASVNHIANIATPSARTFHSHSDAAKAKMPTNHVEATNEQLSSISAPLDITDPNADHAGKDEGQLTPPPAVWQHRRSPSTPPIPIPRPSTMTSHRSDIGPSTGPVTARSASPARALGFAAHLGMTSISHPPSTMLTDSASTSNTNSEGSSRMSSFSETNATIRQSVIKRLSEDLDGKEGVSHSRRRHRSSMAAIAPTISGRGESGMSGKTTVEGAIGTLRRMTISGGERAMFGPLDPQ